MGTTRGECGRGPKEEAAGESGEGSVQVDLKEKGRESA